nr:MAG TPA: signaling protein [Bacteriophage sp.]
MGNKTVTIEVRIYLNRIPSVSRKWCRLNVKCF